MRPLHLMVLTFPAMLAFHGLAAADPLGLPPDSMTVAQATVIWAPTPPPPTREELPPPPPTSTTAVQVWETGHWVWNGAGWEWTHGQYVVRPSTISTTAPWQPGHWVQQANGWIWVEGHWQ